MPILPPPNRRRIRPKVRNEEEEDSNTTMLVSLICVLVIANLIVFCDRFGPAGGDYALAAAPAEVQLSP